MQIWDFDTGLPLEMRKNELCTASCMLNNGEHIVLGRTDPRGASTTMVLWDVLGNEPIRQLSYSACLGQADHIRQVYLVANKVEFIFFGPWMQTKSRPCC